MAAYRFVVFLVVCCASLVAAQNASISPSNLPIANVNQRRQYPPESFRFTLRAPTTPAVNNSAALQFVLDSVASPILTTNPAPGFIQTTTILAPCSILLPHVHPRATEIVFVINGTVSAGIAEENGGRTINFDVTSYQNWFIPQGLVHYTHNNNCEPAYIVTTFNSVDPGTLTLPRLLLGFPIDAVTAFFGQTTDGIQNLNSTLPLPTGQYANDARCQARCNISSASG